jgi:putative hemolysin
MLILFLVIYCLLVILGAASSMAETSYFSLSSGQIQEMNRQNQSPKAQTVAKIVCRPKELLVSLLFFNILVNVLIQNVASGAFSDGSNWLIQVGVPFITTFCFSELLPKIVALNHNVRVSQALAPAVHIALKILRPIIPILTKVANAISRTLFFYLKPKPPIDSKKLLQALESSSEHGEILNPVEKKLMEGLVELQRLKAQDVMWPRSDILFYDVQDPIENLVKLIAEEECGKIPVCQSGLDHVLGIVYGKDLLDIDFKNLSVELVKKHLRKPLFVPESMPAVGLVRILDDAYQSLALVVNEYGNVTGLLSREDLLETVVGEIIDLRDHKNYYTLAEDGSIIANGKWSIEEVSSILNLEFANPYNMQTLGGWLTALAGTIPDSGSRWVYQNYIFEVLAASPTHIRRILILKTRSSSQVGQL